MVTWSILLFHSEGSMDWLEAVWNDMYHLDTKGC